MHSSTIAAARRAVPRTFIDEDAHRHDIREQRKEAAEQLCTLLVREHEQNLTGEDVAAAVNAALLDDADASVVSREEFAQLRAHVAAVWPIVAQIRDLANASYAPAHRQDWEEAVGRLVDVVRAKDRLNADWGLAIEAIPDYVSAHAFDAR